MEPGAYQVRLEQPGYLVRIVEADVRNEDRNVGAIALAATVARA